MALHPTKDAAAGLRSSAPRRVARRAACLVAMIGLAACAPTRGGVVYNTEFTAGYVPASVAAAHPLLVATYGSPAPNLTPESINQATVAALRTSGPPWMPRNYTGNPADVPHPAYVLRIAYGVPKTFDRQQLCAPDMSAAKLDAARTQADAGATRTLASVCRGKSAVALAEGSPGANPDITGKRFSDFVGLLARQLMPRLNPVTKDDCIFLRCD